MSRYGSSRRRVMLLIVLLGIAAFVAADGFAQAPAAPTPTPAPSGAGAGNAAGGAAGTTVTEKPTLVRMILGHPDPVFFTIAALSVAGLALIIQGFIKNRASIMMPPASSNTIRDLIEQRKFKELLEFTETDPSFVSKALNPALKRAPSFSSMKEAMETAVGEQTAEHFRQIEYLNIIGNLGPLLGLLGTVLGMIEAFNAMQASGGNARPSDLAGGISTALTHTFLGLFLAVPCLAAFGVLRTIVDRLTVRGALEAEELLLMIKPTEARPAVTATPPRPGVMSQPAPVAAMPRPTTGAV